MLLVQSLRRVLPWAQTRSTALENHSFVYLVQLRDHAVCSKVTSYPGNSRLTHASPQIGIGKQRKDRLRQVLGVIRRNKKTSHVAFDYLSWTATVRCNYRFSAGHRFNQDHSEWLWLDGTMDDEIRRRIKAENVSLETGKPNGAAQLQVLNLSL